MYPNVDRTRLLAMLPHAVGMCLNVLWEFVICRWIWLINADSRDDLLDVGLGR